MPFAIANFPAPYFLTPFYHDYYLATVSSPLQRSNLLTSNARVAATTHDLPSELSRKSYLDSNHLIRSQ